MSNGTQLKVVMSGFVRGEINLAVLIHLISIWIYHLYLYLGKVMILPPV